MKLKIAILMISTILMSCGAEKHGAKLNPQQLTGTWKLLTATHIEKGDTTITDYTKNISFIKIINDTHFAFLQHDINKGRDSAALFVSGGGKYSLEDNSYTEHLEYCSARNWEGNNFVFTITLTNDTLVQNGIEKVEDAGVNRVNIEKYVRLNE